MQVKLIYEGQEHTYQPEEVGVTEEMTDRQVLNAMNGIIQEATGGDSNLPFQVKRTTSTKTVVGASGPEEETENMIYIFPEAPAG